MLDGWRERAESLRAEVYALSLAARDDRTPLAAKAVAVFLVAYAVSPIDPIPDVIPVLGYLDELVVLPLGVVLTRRLVPDGVMAECRDRADDELDAGVGRWVVAGLTLLAWTLVLWAVVRFVA